MVHMPIAIWSTTIATSINIWWEFCTLLELYATCMFMQKHVTRLLSSRVMELWYSHLKIRLLILLLCISHFRLQMEIKSLLHCMHTFVGCWMST